MKMTVVPCSLVQNTLIASIVRAIASDTKNRKL
jgi:hypothetical protein